MVDNTFDNVFIWTEAFNCGEVLNPMLASYLEHHNSEINVFGTLKDFSEITQNSPRIKLNYLEDTILQKILLKYGRGHWGTAELWAHILKNRPEKYFLHLDSDTIFLDNVTTQLVEAVKVDGFGLAGPRRPYFHRPYRKSGIDGKYLDKLPDTVGTDCFIFDKDFIRLKPFWNLKRKIFGKRPLRHPVVDFFDPVTFEMIRRGCRVLYVDTPEGGSQYKSNLNSKFHSKIISFGAVGSGANFYKNPSIRTSPGYKNFALSSYSLYSRWLLNKDIGINPLHAPELISKLEKLDQGTWTLN
jgi:hypothetical protein